jgi:RNA polymerase sigma-70 factor (ECF subfamily)
LHDGDDDVRLMLAVRAGDASAFDALFRRWSAPLLRYVDRMVRDPAAAEELVQETFLRLYRARERYEPEARFSTWLYTIATRLALNELRRPRRQNPHKSTDEVDEDGATLVLAHGDRAPTTSRTRAASASPSKARSRTCRSGSARRSGWRRSKGSRTRRSRRASRRARSR